MELVLLGAECPDERAFGGSLGAAEGAQRFWRAVTGTLLDAGPGRCRVTSVHPEADANAMLSALKEAASRGGRLLVVYLGGQLAWDERRRRPALVTAGSLRENAARRGLPCDWVTSAMAHGTQQEALLVLDLAADSVAWQEWPAWAEAELEVPAWGRVVRYDAHRRGRGAEDMCAGALAEELTELLDAGAPGAPAALDVRELDARLELLGCLGARPERRVSHARERGARVAGAPIHHIGPPGECRLLLRNRSVLRGALRSVSR
ncbi:hypothetical protein [Streptacidiphilus sp. MAP5-3]|uniref:hypothetical protein n=1 Tax=unclassified Streptacidiphilus TaxID=2643834 RepID=UPI0035193AC4